MNKRQGLNIRSLFFVTDDRSFHRRFQAMKEPSDNRIVQLIVAVLRRCQPGHLVSVRCRDNQQTHFDQSSECHNRLIQCCQTFFDETGLLLDLIASSGISTKTFGKTIDTNGKLIHRSSSQLARAPVYVCQ